MRPGPQARPWWVHLGIALAAISLVALAVSALVLAFVFAPT